MIFFYNNLSENLDKIGSGEEILTKFSSVAETTLRLDLVNETVLVSIYCTIYIRIVHF